MYDFSLTPSFYLSFSRISHETKDAQSQSLHARMFYVCMHTWMVRLKGTQRYLHRFAFIVILNTSHWSSSRTFVTNQISYFLKSGSTTRLTFSWTAGFPCKHTSHSNGSRVRVDWFRSLCAEGWVLTTDTCLFAHWPTPDLSLALVVYCSIEMFTLVPRLRAMADAWGSFSTFWTCLAAVSKLPLPTQWCCCVKILTYRYLLYIFWDILLLTGPAHKMAKNIS